MKPGLQKEIPSNNQREVALKIAPAFDWAPDSRSLVYMRRLSGKSGKLMRLQCLTIPEIEDETIAQLARDLALVFVPFAPRVAVLPDGDVLFAGHPLTLPIRGGKPPGQPRLFTVAVEGGEVREVPTKPGVLPMDLGYFVPSPDGSTVAVVESGSDAVAVIDLATGESELVSPPHPFWKCRTLPAWKSPDALSYAAFVKEDSPLAWKLWQRDREPRQLSADWPLEVTSDWLDFDEPNKE